MKETLVKLLCSIPPLAFDPRKSLSINYEAAKNAAWLQFAFDWITTSHPKCEKNVKRVRQVLLLGVRTPILVNFQIIPEIHDCSFGFKGQPEQMTFLILAWSYIISCRWVELLQSVDEKAALQSRNFADDIEFKEMISKRH